MSIASSTCTLARLSMGHFYMKMAIRCFASHKPKPTKPKMKGKPGRDKYTRASRSSRYKRAKRERISRELLNASDVTKRIKELHEGFKKGNQPTVETFIVLLSKVNDPQQAWEIFDLSLKTGTINLSYGGNIFSQAVEIFCDHDDWEKCLEALEILDTKTIKAPTINDWHAIVDCLNDNDQLEKAVEIAVKAKQSVPNFTFSSETTSSLLESYKLIEDPQRKVKMLDAISKIGIATDRYTYTTLIDACMKDGNTAKAMELFERMKKDGFKPNEVTFSALIDGYLQSREIDKAMETFEVMHKLGISPNVMTYNILSGGLMKAGRSREAWDLLVRMEAEKIRPDTTTYNLLINELVQQVFYSFHPRKAVASHFPPFFCFYW